jgi:C-terminal processing protease CtpA/Prc
MKRFLSGLMALFAIYAQAATLTPEDKRAELQTLAATIRTHYGPLLLKGQTLKVDLAEMVERYAKLAETSTNLEFYYLVNRFVAEFQDSHFGSKLNTDRISKLGFIADRIEGKALIDEIDRTVLTEKAFPYQKGDEIVSVGGRPTADVVKELGSHLGSGNRETNLRAATQLLAHRTAAQVPPQKGKVELEIRRGASTIVEKVTLEWQQSGDDWLGEEPAAWSRNAVVPMDYGDLSVHSFDILPKAEKSFRCSGTTRTEIPKDATKIMEKPFVAYYHPTPVGNIGYLRIPHYNWMDDKGQSANEFRLKQYEYAVYQLEQNTVGLVIDQDHNCGGSVSMVEGMVSLFASKPFTGLQFQFLASRAEYLLFKSWIDEEKKHTVEGIGFTEVLDLMKAAFAKGERLTGLTTFQGSRILQPNPIRYTKPILVLVDEMSGSGGDAFPAMMQGNGFAKLMGKRTMGAGGHVENFAPLIFSANTLRMTKSLFYHPNGKPIENNGVTPDFDYTTTRADFLYGYKEYQAAYLDVLAQLLP